jgi:amino acid transporter
MGMLAADGTGVRSKETGFGTSAVFWTTLSTILGAILFLRMGYAVANVGLVGAIAIVLLGHLVTIPAALAIAEIATNQRVAGGGVYYVLSRSFGLRIGGSIGIALYLSQAISIAFYVIAFGEAFRPLLAEAVLRWSWVPDDLRLVTLPMLGLIWLGLRLRGARLGVSLLVVVAVTLLFSLLLFFLGDSTRSIGFEQAFARVPGADPFFLVFAICFPAFTGLTAGVGLSGDLRDPKHSIPLGTLTAVGAGLVVYLLVVVKLAYSATPAQLAADPLAMASIAIWPPIIPIGLACATLSSALGSIIVAPRTLQALAADRVIPDGGYAEWLRAVRPSDEEPLNAAGATTLIALLFVVLGDVDSVAQIITMFFLITYGAICAVSLLEGFAGDPTYRPAFRSRWYISLFGAVISLIFMFQIDTAYAILALLSLGGIYMFVRTRSFARAGSVELLRGTLFQVGRWIQLQTQRSRDQDGDQAWRPAAVCLSSASFERRAALDFLRWIAHRHGFATYIHFVEGFLSKKTAEEARAVLARLIRLVGASRGNIQVDTMVSPSYTSAFSQLIQLPSSSGMDNNLVVFEYDKANPTGLVDATNHFQLAAATGFDTVVLGSSTRGYGVNARIHLWLPANDEAGANLMILLGYVIASHPDWYRAELAVFDVVPAADRDARMADLRERVRSGRLPIAEHNIDVIALENGLSRRALICERSRDADFTLIGMRREAVRRLGAEAFDGYDAIGNVGFVIGVRDVELERDEQPPEAGPAPEIEETQAKPSAPEEGEGEGGEGEASEESADS